MSCLQSSLSHSPLPLPLSLPLFPPPSSPPAHGVCVPACPARACLTATHRSLQTRNRGIYHALAQCGASPKAPARRAGGALSRGRFEQGAPWGTMQRLPSERLPDLKAPAPVLKAPSPPPHSRAGDGDALVAGDVQPLHACRRRRGPRRVLRRRRRQQRVAPGPPASLMHAPGNGRMDTGAGSGVEFRVITSSELRLVPRQVSVCLSAASAA
jgi:hypothetical protein